MTLRYLIPLSAALLAPAAHATCALEPMLGSVCMFAGNFCPRGYAEAAGQILPINQNSALFSILGTTYGGNGQSTFALPDLRGRSAVGVGQGGGLSPVELGEKAGTETVTLNVSQMPVHSHAAVVRGTTAAGTSDSPANAVPAKLARSNNYSSGAADTNLGASAITVATAGGSQPVPTRNPYLGLKMCIALQGVFPSRD